MWNSGGDKTPVLLIQNENREKMTGDTKEPEKELCKQWERV